MLTVKGVCDLTGVSARTLRFYDEIGLLKPTEVRENGYRGYDEMAIEKLRDIMLMREVEYPLKDIAEMMGKPNYDRNKALGCQIGLLRLKKERLSRIIDMAAAIMTKGVNNMDFEAFDTKKIEEYSKKAKELWGDTMEYKEFEERGNKSKSADEGLMEIFADFGRIKDGKPDSKEAREIVKKLQKYITDNYYTCSLPALKSLSFMYASGGEMTDNIDKKGGKGTGQFACDAIQAYEE